jgi:endonuclease/exonuclease/phosphatase family metal-dependent hydrolase
MKRLTTLIPAFLASFLFPTLAQAADSADSAVAAPAGLSIVSWNVEWYPGKNRFARTEQRLEHAALVQAELKKINPDILLAQEMRDWQSFAELTDASPGLRPVVVSNFMSEQSGEYWPQQVAIASKLPVQSAWSEAWKAGEIQPRRGFTSATVRVPGSLRVLLVYSLHLKSNRSNNEEEAALNYQTRDESVRQLLLHVKEMEEIAFKDRVAGVVIGGDFNTNHDGQFGDKVVELMKNGGFHHTWEGTPREERLTWRGSQRFEATTFDHFFTKGLGEIQATMLEVPDATSDHWPVQIVVPMEAMQERAQ